jgi:enamine deaminase RidA (YjgF/YER057c/UK114 family)
MIIPVPQSAYSQAVKVKGGTLLFLSGVGPVDEKGVLAAPRVLSFRASAELGNFDAQFKRTFDKIKNTLDKAGGSLDDIVSLSVFLTDLCYLPAEAGKGTF